MVHRNKGNGDGRDKVNKHSTKKETESEPKEDAGEKTG
jgi:hypothetical protein